MGETRMCYSLHMPKFAQNFSSKIDIMETT